MNLGNINSVMSLHGKIKSVYCENFITYDVCRFHPGKFLNIIVGPNGSGKSTILAAIVIGLGGHPRLLGKSTNLDDYIKNGKEYSLIQIELYTESLQIKTKRPLGSVVFSRRLTKNNQSEWMINGKPIEKNEFLKQAATYYIQLDNLCQVLPQERVQDFTRMNAQELFLNTITSVCKSDISTTFKMLKDMQEERETGKSCTQSLKQKLEEQNQRLEQLDSLLQSFHSYKELNEKINICKVKILQQETIHIDKKLEEQCQQISNDENHKETLNREYNTIYKHYSDIEHTKAQNARDIEYTADRISQSIQNLENNKKEIDNCWNAIMKEQAKFVNDKRVRVEKELELKTRLLILRGCQQDLKDLNGIYVQSNCDDVHRNINKTKTTIKELDERYSQIKNLLDLYQAEEESIKRYLLTLRNIPEQKLLLLKGEHADVHKAVTWLDSNRHFFKKHIYKPLMIELNVRNSYYAQYLENVIGIQYILAFICECKSDMAILIKELCVNRNLIVNVVLLDGDDDDRIFEPNIPIEQLRQYGFEYYLIDQVEGPSALLKYLCSNYNIQNIPYGNESIMDLLDEIPSQITSYFAGRFRFTVFKSEYSNEKCLMQAEVESLGLFSCIDDREINLQTEKLHDLKNKTDRLENEYSIVEANLQQQKLIFEEQMKKENEFSLLKSQIQSKEQEMRKRKIEYDKLNADINSLAGKQPIKLSGYINEIIKQQLAAVKTLKSVTADYARSLFFEEQKLFVQQQFAKASKELENIEGKKKKLENAIEQTSKNLEDLKRKRKAKEAEMITLREQCNLDNNHSRHYDFYSNLTDDVIELSEMINEYSGRIICLNNDATVTNEYNAVKQEIHNLNRIVSDKVEENEHIDAKMQSIYHNWLPIIQQIIADINRNFGKLMQAVSYVGEVRLGRNHEFDFQSYGIEILVQFRKDMPLQLLCKSTQSGGERSISIAAYTLAMQQLTIVPFRCVDEINQGMDPSNERKFFNMLVNTTTEQNQAQYFYITPKLLSNLNSHDKMTVHVLYNGRVTSAVFN